MTEFAEVNEDLVDSWGGFSDCDDDLDVFLVPEDVECEGAEAVDEFLHRKALRNMSKNVYDRG